MFRLYPKLLIPVFVGLGILWSATTLSLHAQSQLGDSAWLMFRHNNYRTGLSPLTGNMDICGLDWYYTTGSKVYSSPALGDIDGDGQLEVVVGSWDGKVYALNGVDGSLL